MSISAQLTCNSPKPPLTLAELAPLFEDDAGAEFEGRIVFDVGPVNADPEPDALDPEAALREAEDVEEPLEADVTLDAENEPELDADDVEEPEDEPEDVDETDDPELPEGLEDNDKPLKH